MIIKIDQSKIKEAEQEILNKESREYLTSTDWYVIRQLETGIDIPEEILIKRQTAREAIK